MTKINLAGDWNITWGDGAHGNMAHYLIPMDDQGRYMECKFPGSIQSGLVKAGIIDDPTIGINSLKARWVEEQFWILRKSFIVPAEATHQNAVLAIEVIDGVSKVAINGQTVGEHWNAHHPAHFNLSGVLQPGVNEIVVLLESGLFKVADLNGKDYSIAQDTLLNKRYHLRQAQYQFGWDWNPRLVFIGLHGRMEIEWGITPRLGSVAIIGDVAEDLNSAVISVKPIISWTGDNPADITLKLHSIDNLKNEKTVQVLPGENELEIGLEISQPRLWYPRGYGKPERYPLSLEVVSSGETVGKWEGQIGLRRVEISQPPHPEKGKYFHLRVNNQVVFCKGGNWVPPEMSAHEVDASRIEKLVDLAIEENMNMLRIWGGGVWAGHTLLNLCDQYGIMVWHDLLFACSKYPADQPAFYAEVEKEVTWGLREYSYHPSLMVWCGNNELEWGLWSWGYKDFGRVAPDFVLFHHLFPILAAKIAPQVPYWPSSPYSSETEFPNDPTRGDQHPWGVTLGVDGVNFWAYRQYVDRFPNEGGVLGCVSVASMEKFINKKDLKMRSFAWEHHDNTVDYWKSVPGPAYDMVRTWLGKQADSMTLDEYAIASGLLQAEGLKEYINNFSRRFPSTTSAIYWDFNDSWPTVHGWTTFDYYLDRKLSFHPVRRAFSERLVVLADEGKEIGVYAVNQTPVNIRVTIESGYFSEKKSSFLDHPQQYDLAPHSSTRLKSLERDDKQIAFVLMKDSSGCEISRDRLLLRSYKEWEFTQPEIHTSVIQNSDRWYARYESSGWVWGVVLDPSGTKKVKDDVFDLFPGIPYDVLISENEQAPQVITTGNHLFLNRIQK
jgi:beta-mannosidase